MSEPIISKLEELTAQNEAKATFLRMNGIPVPSDQMYTTSLLEYLLLDVLNDAKLYHEERIGSILDKAIQNFQIRQAQAAEQAAAQAQEQASAERTAVLLRGVRG